MVVEVHILLVIERPHQLLSVILAIAFYEECSYLLVIGLMICTLEQRIFDKQAFVRVFTKDVIELIAHRVKTEESEQVLQVYPSDICRSIHLCIIHLLYHLGLTPVQHLAHVLWYLIKYTLEGQHKRVFVAVAEWTIVQNPLQECLAAKLLNSCCYTWVIYIIRCKPVDNLIEERESLHLRETSEIDIGALLLHIYHLAETSFHLLKFLLVLAWMQYFVEGALFVLLHNTTTHYVQILSLYHIGHYLLLYHVAIFICPQTEVHLFLQFYKLLHALGILQCGSYKLTHLREQEFLYAFVYREHPSHQSTLAHILV